ncbi:MAG: translation initiation factor [FCB group bacterium]|jgi:translation initiation factor 1|nr:translation initiation factor [FCB group bacterium]
MAKQQKRQEKFDVRIDTEPLTDNPFAALRPDAPAPRPTPEPPQIESSSGFRVERTRKGGLPIFLEKRPGGKSVTVIRNLSGDLEEVLTRLKKLCGAGGALKDDTIEIQGDHRPKIETYLKENAGK